MAEQTAARNTPAQPPPPPTEPIAVEKVDETSSPAASEVVKKAPEAVRRSMPMALSIAIGILLAGLMGWLVQYLMWLILIVYLSIIVATVMDVPVGWVMRLRLRRGMAAVIVMLAGLGVVVGLVALMA